MANILIPEFCLVLLIGVAGCGKSTFAKRHFKKSEIISSDFCREMIIDDENDQSVTSSAFDLLYQIVDKRLAFQKLTVVDATNLQAEHRNNLKALAKANNCQRVAFVFNLPETLCQTQNQARSTRQVEIDVIHQQIQELNLTMQQIPKEKFHSIVIFENQEAISDAVIQREKLKNNLKDLTGPFDIIGDIHGCFDELTALLTQLGYAIDPSLIVTDQTAVTAIHNRKVIFLGDLVDRGPNAYGVLNLVMNMVNHGKALCVPGNHDMKLVKYLKGKNISLTHGLDVTAKEFETVSASDKQKIIVFLENLVDHYVLDHGNLIVAHAGMKQAYQGRISNRVKHFALYGQTTGEYDEMKLPVRLDWAQSYVGQGVVVYGHTPMAEAIWVNNTICIDTGCVFGGKLTALRYPEKELVSVQAKQVYWPRRLP